MLESFRLGIWRNKYTSSTALWPRWRRGCKFGTHEQVQRRSQQVRIASCRCAGQDACHCRCVGMLRGETVRVLRLKVSCKLHLASCALILMQLARAASNSCQLL
jgi:hypothetical protein